MGQGAKPNTHIQWLMAISPLFILSALFRVIWLSYSNTCFLCDLFEWTLFIYVFNNGYFFFSKIKVLSLSVRITLPYIRGLTPCSGKVQRKQMILPPILGQWSM
jgi:hypothetical protein